MKSASVSLEAAGVPSVARNGSTFSTVFDRRLLLIGLWVFAGYYVGCKIGFALTFPSPGFRSLAAEFCPGCGAFADATTRLVVRAAGRISGAFGGAIPESRSTADDFVLVRQQFV